MLDGLKNLVKAVSNIHVPGDEPDVFVFTTPRGGSTWFMEIICSQKGFRYCSEPLNMRSEQIRRYLRINTWEGLYDPETSDKFHDYFNRIIDGRLPFIKPNPFRKYYRPYTTRMVFKIIHGGVDRINWFRDEFNAKVLLCLRHPIPVSLSRVEYPFLDRFQNSCFQEQFTDQQVQFAADIIRSGNKLQRGVVAWCIHNMVPINSIEDDWAVVTYEQSVIQPDPIIDYLCLKLMLRNPERIRKQLGIPSRSVILSDEETRNMLKQLRRDDNRSILVEKWRKRVTNDDIVNVQEILDIFGIDIYRADQFLPADAYWIGCKP